MINFIPSSIDQVAFQLRITNLILIILVILVVINTCLAIFRDRKK
jgi:hypothetical protein